MFGYLVWLLASLRVLDYQNKVGVSVLFLLCIAGGVAATVAQLRKFDASQRRHYLKTFLYLELASFVLFYVYLYVRSFNVAIYGTERFMDMALLTAAGKTHYFPFIDSWYAGKTVNYYYYGSYLVSLLANVSRTQYVLAYTASLGLLFSTACTVAGSLVYEVTSSKKFALLGAFFVTTAGMMFYAAGVIRGALANPSTVYSYASSTRLYSPSYIINEIPSYSFTVGDLHAHLLGLSFFLANLTVLYAFSKAKRPSWVLVFLLAIGMATSIMVNSWDAITMSFLVLLAVLFKDWNDQRLIKKWIVAGASIAVCMVVLALPFLLNFHSPVLGIRYIPSYVAEYNLKNVQWPTPFWALAGEWGVFAVGITWALVVLRKRLREYVFPITLSVMSVLILVGVEFFFVPDIYSVANPPYFRANTVFKFGYQAWSMLAIAFTVLLWAAFNSGRLVKAQRWVVGGVLGIVLVLSSVYPYQALRQYYGLLGGAPQAQAQTQTLDGMAFMDTAGPGDYEAVQWINENIPERSVFIEAAGQDYSYFGRISVFTGMEDPINWLSHEWTWRFNAKAAKLATPDAQVETGYGAIAAISADVQTIYESTDVSQTQALLQKYGAQYVYVGGLERATYASLDEDKFYQLGTVVYDSGNVQIFKLQ